MNQTEIKKLKEIVVYKGLSFFQHEQELMAKFESLGYVSLESKRLFASPTLEGIDFIISGGYLK